MAKEYKEHSRLIDKLEYYQNCFQTELDYNLALAVIEGTEVDDDVVEVVRCEECKYRHSSEFCECRSPDAFCSDGERMNE